MAEQEAVATYEQELAKYLQERIKPNLNSGAIPLLARSIAKDIARESGDAPARPQPEQQEQQEQQQAEEPAASNGASNGASASSADQDEGEAPDFEADMHDLQSELGEDWILRFSVKGETAWLTAEKEDGSQRLEAPTASALSAAVEILNAHGGRDAE